MTDDSVQQLDDDTAFDYPFQQQPNVEAATQENTPVRPPDFPKVQFDRFTPSTAARTTSKRLAMYVPGPDDTPHRTGRTHSQTRALREGNVVRPEYMVSSSRIKGHLNMIRHHISWHHILFMDRIIDLRAVRSVI